MLSLILLDLTISDVLSDIPRDAGAIFVYVLLVVFIAMIWAGNRGGTPGAGDAEDV